MTTPVYLVRHAKAGDRTRWTDPDHLRPLTKPGRRQADALDALFADQPFSRLLTSPYVRCVETLYPLAEARGLPLETAGELAEGAPIAGAVALMLAVAADGPAALCTHGDVMWEAVDHVRSAGVTFEEPLEFKKSATWIFEVDAGAFIGARYVPPPGKDA